MNATTAVRTRPHQKATNPYVGALLLVAILAILGVSAHLFSTGTATEVEDVESSVEGFLNAATSGDYAGAYGYLSEERRSTYDANDFSSSMKSDSRYASITALTRLDFDKARTGVYQYKGRVTYADGTQGTLTAQLGSEDGAWKIRAIEIER